MDCTKNGHHRSDFIFPLLLHSGTFATLDTKLDFSGRLAGLFSTGCAFGGMVIVPLVNYIIKVSDDDNALTWAILSLTICQVLAYLSAWTLSKKETYHLYPASVPDEQYSMTQVQLQTK